MPARPLSDVAPPWRCAPELACLRLDHWSCFPYLLSANLVTNLPSPRRALRRSAPVAGSINGRCHTCAGTPVDDRSASSDCGGGRRTSASFSVREQALLLRRARGFLRSWRLWPLILFLLLRNPE